LTGQLLTIPVLAGAITMLMRDQQRNKVFGRLTQINPTLAAVRLFETAGDVGEGGAR
jgi:hypothetical protein